jgi:hypothetical protein
VYELRLSLGPRHAIGLVMFFACVYNSVLTALIQCAATKQPYHKLHLWDDAAPCTLDPYFSSAVAVSRPIFHIFAVWIIERVDLHSVVVPAQPGRDRVVNEPGKCTVGHCFRPEIEISDRLTAVNPCTHIGPSGRLRDSPFR